MKNLIKVLFYSIFKSGDFLNEFVHGQSNMHGKIQGLDKSMNQAQIEDLQDFIENNNF